MWWLGICFSRGEYKRLCHTSCMRFQVITLFLKNVMMSTNMSNIHFTRSYWASNSPNTHNTWQQAMQFCENMGKGLVKWDTADSYLDLKHLSDQGAFWTALTNTNGEDCDGANACNGLLVKILSWSKMTPSQNCLVSLAVATNFWWANSNVLVHFWVL